MTNVTRQPGEHRKGAEIDSLVEFSRLPVLSGAVYNAISSSLATRPTVARPIIEAHEAQLAQTEPAQTRPVYEAAPVAASVALDATVEATPVVTNDSAEETDILHEEPSEFDPIAEEARWRDLESAVAPQPDELAMGAQVDAAFAEQGIATFPEAEVAVSQLDAARAQVDAALGSQPGME